MRLGMLSFALLLGLVVGACTDPEEEDLGTFLCGDVECDVRSEYCNINDQCDGTVGTQTCRPVPDECDGRATVGCLSGGGNGCAEVEEGGIACSPSCG